MADVKESALTQKSDCKWVRALDANGNSIRISKEDLAAVVGELMSEATTTKKGLMPSKQVWMTQLGAYTEDLNDVKRECRLEINSSTINNPVGDWALCETKYFSNMCIQIVYEYLQVNSIYVRSYNNSRWAGWRKISVSYSG